MGKIKDLPKTQRPREKALQYGINVLSDYELLALIIQSGVKNKSVMELCFELISTFHGFNNVFLATYEQLIKCDGINKVKALKLLAIQEIIIRINKNNQTIINNKFKITCGNDVYNYFYLKVENLLVENLIVLYLNIKNCIIYEEIVSIGDDSKSIGNAKLICKHAIEKMAKKVIICHNHPSGNSSPSLDDIAFYFNLKKALEYVSIKLLDHIIIGKNEFYSIKDEKKYIIEKN